MSRRAIVRNDLRSASGERGVWLLGAGFVLGFAGLAVLLVRVGAPEFDAYLDLLAPGVGLLVPLAGIVLGYETVVGERETGTAVLALSMPNGRADLLLGKLVSRTALLAGATALGALAGGVVAVASFTGFDPVRYVGFTLATAGYGIVFCWLAAGLSTLLPSSRRVIGAAFGAYIGLGLSWNVLIDATVLVLFRFRGSALADPPTWAVAATFVGPRTAFNYLLATGVDAGTVPPVAVDATAWFVTAPVAALVLVAWAVLPVLVGYATFRRHDL